MREKDGRRRGRPSRRWKWTVPSPQRARFWSGSGLAASAGPISTWWTATCRSPSSIVLGHEIVGTVEAAGPEVESLAPGDRVGVPWLGFPAVGAAIAGAAGKTCAKTHAIPDTRSTAATRIYGRGCARCSVCHAYGDVEAAPFYAGLIDRAYRMAGDPARIGIYGFGAAAHIMIQVALWEGREVFAFTRPGDRRRRTSPVPSAQHGRARRIRHRRNRWTRRSSSRRSAPWCWRR